MPVVRCTGSKFLSANWTFSLECVPLIKKVWITELTLVHTNIRSVCYLHAPVYWSIRCKTHYDITDKNNNVSSEDRHYHKYPWTRLDISDNVCLDLQNCCYSVYVTKLISKSRRVSSFLQSIFIF